MRRYVLAVLFLLGCLSLAEAQPFSRVTILDLTDIAGTLATDDKLFIYDTSASTLKRVELNQVCTDYLLSGAISTSGDITVGGNNLQGPGDYVQIQAGTDAAGTWCYWASDAGGGGDDEINCGVVDTVGADPGLGFSVYLDGFDFALSEAADHFLIKDGVGGSIVFDVDRSGNLQIDGNLTAANFNGSASTWHGAIVYNASTVNNNSGTTYTALAAGAEIRDSNAFHSTGSDTERIVVPSSTYAGYYRANCEVEFPSDAVGRRAVRIVRYNSSNVSQENLAEIILGANASGVTHLTLGGDSDTAASGDYFTCEVYQDSTSTLLVALLRFSAHLVGS
jgi:hypothetical protein